MALDDLENTAEKSCQNRLNPNKSSVLMLRNETKSSCNMKLTKVDILFLFKRVLRNRRLLLKYISQLSECEMEFFPGIFNCILIVSIELKKQNEKIFNQQKVKGILKSQLPKKWNRHLPANYTDFLTPAQVIAAQSEHQTLTATCQLSLKRY